MIKGSKAQRILANKACASTANRTVLKRKRRDSISHKAVPGRPLCPSKSQRIEKRLYSNREAPDASTQTSLLDAIIPPSITVQ